MKRQYIIAGLAILLVGFFFTGYYLLNLSTEKYRDKEEAVDLQKEATIAVTQANEDKIGMSNNNNDVSMLRKMIVEWRKTTKMDKDQISLRFCEFLMKEPELFYEKMKEEEKVFDEWMANLEADIFITWPGGPDREELRLAMIERLSGIELEEPADRRNKYLISKLKKITVAVLPEKPAGRYIPEKGVNWRELDIAWRAYLNYPNSYNAMRVYHILPDSLEWDRTETDEFGRACRENIYQNLFMLNRQVISGDRAALKLAFRMQTISDGAFASGLAIMCGSIIRIDPQMFLEVFKEHRYFEVRMDALLGNEGEVYYDRMMAGRYEIQQRITALESVSDPELIGLRDECLEVLRERDQWWIFTEYYPPR